MSALHVLSHQSWCHLVLSPFLLYARYLTLETSMTVSAIVMHPPTQLFQFYCVLANQNGAARRQGSIPNV
jgi:hypothetical protein